MTAAEPRVHRRQTVRLGLGALWLLPAALLAYFALDLGGEGIPAGQRAVYGSLAAAFLVLAVRTLRIGVATGPCGVTVRGVLRTWTVPWEEVERFAWGAWRGPGGWSCGVVRRRDGSSITVFALNPPFELRPGEDRTVPDLLEALNARLAAARGWSEPPDSGAPPDPRAAPAASH
jgi:hypothetical protein